MITKLKRNIISLIDIQRCDFVANKFKIKKTLIFLNSLSDIIIKFYTYPKQSSNLLNLQKKYILLFVLSFSLEQTVSKSTNKWDKVIWVHASYQLIENNIYVIFNWHSLFIPVNALNKSEYSTYRRWRLFWWQHLRHSTVHRHHDLKKYS